MVLGKKQDFVGSLLSVCLFRGSCSWNVGVLLAPTYTGQDKKAQRGGSGKPRILAANCSPGLFLLCRKSHARLTLVRDVRGFREILFCGSEGSLHGSLSSLAVWKELSTLNPSSLRPSPYLIHPPILSPIFCFWQQIRLRDREVQYLPLFIPLQDSNLKFLDFSCQCSSGSWDGAAWGRDWKVALLGLGLPWMAILFLGR